MPAKDCKAVQLQNLTEQFRSTCLGELREHPEHDAGEDLVAVEGAVVRPDLDRLHHLAICDVQSKVDLKKLINLDATHC